MKSLFGHNIDMSAQEIFKIRYESAGEKRAAVGT